MHVSKEFVYCSIDQDMANIEEETTLKSCHRLGRRVETKEQALGTSRAGKPAEIRVGNVEAGFRVP